MKDWFTLDEIAGLPAMPESRDHLWRRSNREGWRWGMSKDGKVHYHITGLPKSIRKMLEEHYQ